MMSFFIKIKWIYSQSQCMTDTASCGIIHEMYRFVHCSQSIHNIIEVLSDMVGKVGQSV